MRSADFGVLCGYARVLYVKSLLRVTVAVTAETLTDAASCGRGFRAQVLGENGLCGVYLVFPLIYGLCFGSQRGSL